MTHGGSVGVLPFNGVFLLGAPCADHFRWRVLSHSEAWQTVAKQKAKKQKKNPFVCFCFSHPKFSSLWLGSRRFPNKLAETCCL